MKPLLPVVLACAGLLGCASLSDTRTPAIEGYEAARATLQLPLRRNLTPFADGLRCMDLLIQQHGVKASIMIEDIPDKTQKSAAGAPEMLISAMSQMTKRSGSAIRTVAFGGEVRNLIDMMRSSGARVAFQPENVPAYAVRGAVSQFDENLARKTVDAGVSLGPLGKLGLGGGTAKSTTINLIAVDFALINAKDFSVVPGVSSHNVAAIVQDGSGVDAEVSYHNRIGVNFSSSFAKSDGKGIALRNLVELSAIELIGRFARLPYWRCLGVADDHPDVVREIDDWFEAMTTADKLRFFLAHFRTHGILPAGAEEVDPALFKLAFRAYADVLKADKDTISRQLFRAHFATEPQAAGEQAAALFEAERQKLLALNLEVKPGQGRSDGGIVLTLNQPAYVHCFLRDDETQVFRQLAPSARARQKRLQAGQALRLRDLTHHPFAPHPHRTQTLACIASAVEDGKDLSDLWAQVAKGGTAQPGLAEIKQIRSRLLAGGGYAAMTVLVIKGRGAK